MPFLSTPNHESEERWREGIGRRCAFCSQKLTFDECRDFGNRCLACVAGTDPDRD